MTQFQLKERSLVETGNGNLILQPVIMEYVTQRFIKIIERKITTSNLNLFTTHVLIETQAQYYLRDAQIQMMHTSFNRASVNALGNASST
ncbi:hypothetical protein [Coleofasciculus sp. H7-2]|uniref:hypothetical protein n=1 Tax=Coleofasciculus sp. H7-2 TaxID=3351545 RepID=UPI0036715601